MEAFTRVVHLLTTPLCLFFSFSILSASNFLNIASVKTTPKCLFQVCPSELWICISKCLFDIYLAVLMELKLNITQTLFIPFHDSTSCHLTLRSDLTFLHFPLLTIGWILSKQHSLVFPRSWETVQNCRDMASRHRRLQVWAFPQTSCVTLDNFFKLSMPQFPYL